jgi:FkbM family methyltransferase
MSLSKLKNLTFSKLNGFFMANTNYELVRRRSIAENMWRLMLKYRGGYKQDDADAFISFCLEHYKSSNSQLLQDLWVLFELHRLGIDPKGLFFIEFGVFDGRFLSNTLLLEEDYGWDGVVCEPMRHLHDDILRSRSVPLEKRCVYSVTGKSLRFSVADSSERSGLSSHIQNDSLNRKISDEYDVETVSLDDLVKSTGKPFIHYMSIDTEGSEYEILRSHSWETPVCMLTVEHNYGLNKNEIFRLLSERGYTQRFSNLSQYDGWWIHNGHMRRLSEHA